jgi:hypothetical protein
MRRFIRYCLLFIVPCYLLLTVADFLFSRVAKHSGNQSIESWNEILDGGIDADVLVVGSSRVTEHVNPLVLDSILTANTYVLGMDGRAIYSQIKKYHVYREFNTKPKLIIQNVDVFSMIKRLGVNKAQFFPFFWNESIRNTFFPEEPFTVWEKYLPMYRYLNINYRSDMPGIRAFLPDGNKKLTKGYRGLNKPWDGSALAAVDSIPFLVDSACVQAFKDYLTEVKADGIQVVFVFCPLYAGATQKMTCLKEVHNFYYSIAHDYSIPVLDYTTMLICSDSTYFYNAMHLNKRGSIMFSDSLANDIKKLDVLK